MDFETKVDYNIPELNSLNSAQNKASRVYEWISEVKSKSQNPAEVARDLTDIINMIKELNSKVPELEKIYVTAQSMSLHIMGFKDEK